jgi:predicted metal-dependent phosphoesterase TrpH
LPSQVDLHTHTTASDGTLSPERLFTLAVELKIHVLSITDHDSIDGWKATQALQLAHPEIRVIPGIEMSAEGEIYCHLLGYFIDVNASGFEERLAELRRQRLDRIKAMTQKINAMGIGVDYARVLALGAGGSVGRPHLADALIEMKVVRSRQEAFDRFLKRGGPAYVSSDGPTAAETIALIRSAGGVPVLAHPSYYTTPEFLKRLVDLGLQGLEVYYPDVSRSLIQRYLELAGTFGLVVTGGSDFHGSKTQRDALACVDVPESVVEALVRVAQV